MSVEAELENSIQYSPLQRMRHSAGHVMAEAVQEMFPDAKFAIGPAIEDGFYYDFDLPRPLTPSDFSEIEQRMAKIITGLAPLAAMLLASNSCAPMESVFSAHPLKIENFSRPPLVDWV